MHMDVLGKIAGAIIIVFRLHYIGLIRIPLLMMEARFEAKGVNAKHGFGALIPGTAFAFGWTFGLGALLYPPAWILMGFCTVKLGLQGGGSQRVVVIRPGGWPARRFAHCPVCMGIWEISLHY